jgi:DNA-binding protein YbaB
MSTEFSGRDLDRVRRMAARAQAVARATSGQATVLRGAVTVEVSPDGSLQEIRFAPTALRSDPQRLAAAVKEGYCLALADARRAVRAAIDDPEFDGVVRDVESFVREFIREPESASAEPQPMTEEEMDRYYRRSSWLR